MPCVENMDKLIAFCAEMRSFGEILSFMGAVDRTKFRRKYIYPLLEAGILELTVPGKPNSRNQKYRLTPPPKGMSLAKSLDEKS